MAQLVRLNNGFVNVDSNAPGVSCFDVAGESDADAEPFGDVPIMQALGLSSLPAPPDANGHAEGVLLEGVGGLPGIVIAAWDTRSFSLFGSLEGGDTVLHSTGPAKAAQVLCKEKKRQVVLATLDMDGEPVIVALDGKNRKFQVCGWGLMIELSPENGIVLEAGSARLVVHPDNGVIVQGGLTLGGAVPVPPAVSSWAAIAAFCAAPLIPVPNVQGAL
jgi:hypothetical protein